MNLSELIENGAKCVCLSLLASEGKMDTGVLIGARFFPGRKDC